MFFSIQVLKLNTNFKTKVKRSFVLIHFIFLVDRINIQPHRLQNLLFSILLSNISDLLVPGLHYLNGIALKTDWSWTHYPHFVP